MDNQVLKFKGSHALVEQLNSPFGFVVACDYNAIRNNWSQGIFFFDKQDAEKFYKKAI